MSHDKPTRPAVADLPADEFRRAGHALVDAIADFYASLPERPVTRAEAPAEVRALLDDTPLPDQGRPAGELLEHTAQLLFDHSLHNGHPRFFGYITSSATPLGALGDLLAASVNNNLGKWDLSPLACEIEAQSCRWIAELVGYPTDCGGIMSTWDHGAASQGASIPLNQAKRLRQRVEIVNKLYT